MNKRESDLLRFLHSRHDWTTAAQLADGLCCSVRSVKATVAGLNQADPGCILSSRSGYRLGKLPSNLGDSLVRVPESPEERRSFILRKLLMETPEINMEDLAAQLYVSYSTLSNELPQLRASLKKYSLGLQIRKSKLRITGTEIDKKRALNQLIYDEAKQFFNNVATLNEYFPDLDLNNIRRIVNEVLLSHRFYLNDYTLFNLLLHIAIIIERNKHGFSTDNEDPESRVVTIPAHICTIVRDICVRVSALLGVSFTATDEYSFCVILFTRCIRQDDPPNGSVLGPAVRTLTLQICESVKDAFDISMDDSDFLVRFGLHLENMLLRLQSGVQLRNPQLSPIRSHYPYIYDIAVFIAKIIKRQTELAVSEDEIGYIALHIGGLIEQTNRERARIHTVLLYLGYYENGIMLLKKIARTFADDLLIEDLISSQEQLMEFPDCGLLIYTAPLEKLPAIPHVQISSYLSIPDVSAIADKLKQIKSRQLMEMMEKQIKELFKPELFHYAPDCRTADEFLLRIGNEMESLGYAEEGFYQKLKEREQISSSTLGNLAIPHPIDMDAKQSAISVALYPKGLFWGSSRVNIIFTLAIRKEDRTLFRHIFEFVSEIVTDPSRLKALMKVTTYSDFIRVLVSCGSV